MEVLNRNIRVGQIFRVATLSACSRTSSPCPAGKPRHEGWLPPPCSSFSGAPINPATPFGVEKPNLAPVEKGTHPTPRTRTHAYTYIYTHIPNVVVADVASTHHTNQQKKGKR